MVFNQEDPELAFSGGPACVRGHCDGSLFSGVDFSGGGAAYAGRKHDTMVPPCGRVFISNLAPMLRARYSMICRPVPLVFLGLSGMPEPSSSIDNSISSSRSVRLNSIFL